MAYHFTGIQAEDAELLITLVYHSLFHANINQEVFNEKQKRYSLCFHWL